MKTKKQYVGVLFITALLFLLFLQGLWLYNTYQLVRKDLESKVEGILARSIEQEADLRFVLSVEKNNNLPADSIATFNFVIDDNDLDSNGVLSQQTNVIQELLAFDGFPFDLPVLDSLFNAALMKKNIKAKYAVQYRDSGGIIKEVGDVVSKKAFATKAFPIIGSTKVQALVDISVPIVLKQDMYIFAVSSVLFVLLIAFLFYVRHVIYMQQALLRLRDDFTSALTHNMHTPLSSVYMVLDGLKNGYFETDPDMRDKMISSAIMQVEDLLAITDTILIISRSEHNRLALEPGYVDVSAIIEKVVEKYTLLPVKNKTVEISSHCDVDRPVFADKVHLTGVIDNLVDNAIKYSGKQVAVHIRCYLQKDRLYIHVEDTGYGIPIKDMPYIFDKFERSDAVNRKEAKGFGLGLHYVKRIVEMHGGNVSVKSEKGMGSKFVVDIPIHTSVN